MNTELSWKTRLFSSTWNIYRKGWEVGFIKMPLPFLARKGVAEIDGKKYEFHEKQYFKITANTEITDVEADRVVGKIKFDEDDVKALIKIDNDVFEWKYKTLWKNEFTVHNSEGISISYNGSWSGLSGQIETNGSDDDVTKILSGLYIVAVYVRYAAVTLGIVLAVIVALVLAGVSIMQILRWIF